MSIQKMIQESINGNPLEMKEALAEELRNRIRLALEAKMKDEDEDDDEDDEKYESVEQIDEGWQTVHSHPNGLTSLERNNVGKDDEEYHVFHYKHPTSQTPSSTEFVSKNYHAAVKKYKDIANAKESKSEKYESVEQIDELKKSTLASYVSKAADNAATHGMKYGEKKAQSDEMDRMMNRHMSYSDKDQVRKIMKTTSDDVDAPRRKAAKRLKGIDLAAKKLSKD